MNLTLQLLGETKTSNSSTEMSMGVAGGGGEGGGEGGAPKAGGVQWCRREQCITLTTLGVASTTGSDTHPQGKSCFHMS